MIKCCFRRNDCIHVINRGVYKVKLKRKRLVKEYCVLNYLFYVFIKEFGIFFSRVFFSTSTSLFPLSLTMLFFFLILREHNYWNNSMGIK